MIRRSLEAVLDVYPHFCGYLYLPPYDPEKARTNYNDRYGRLRLTWGGEDEPGVHLDFRTNDRPLSSVLSRSDGPQDSIHVSGKDDDIVPPSSLFVQPRRPPSDPRDKVCLGIRVTRFSCGGHSISAAFHHSLADAQHLSSFMRDWSAVHSEIHGSRPLSLRPEDRPFCPELLDQSAVGDIDAADEDAQFKVEAEGLPMLALDWWASSEGKPSFMSTATEPPAEVADQVRTYGRRIPWENVEWSAKVLDRVLLFSPVEIDAIQNHTLESFNTAVVGRPRISKLDCLLGFVWRLLTQARLDDGSITEFDELTMDVSVGLRPRTSPPLPYTFGGSPIVNLSATCPARNLATGAPIQAAQAIRHTVDALTPAKTSALLHHMAHALDPVRQWNCFFGEKNLLVTSWLDSGMYQVDFGCGKAAEVRAIMPAADGVICIVEVPPAVKVSSARWTENGAGVRLFARAAVISKFLALLERSRKQWSTSSPA